MEVLVVESAVIHCLLPPSGIPMPGTHYLRTGPQRLTLGTWRPTSNVLRLEAKYKGLRGITGRFLAKWQQQGRRVRIHRRKPLKYYNSRSRGHCIKEGPISYKKPERQSKPTQTPLNGKRPREYVYIMPSGFLTYLWGLSKRISLSVSRSVI